MEEGGVDYSDLSSCLFQRRIEDEFSRYDVVGSMPTDQSWESFKFSHFGMGAVRTFYHSKWVQNNPQSYNDCLISDTQIPLAKGLRREYRRLMNAQQESTTLDCGNTGKPEHRQLSTLGFWPAYSLERTFYLEKAGIHVVPNNSPGRDILAIERVAYEVGIRDSMMHPMFRYVDVATRKQIKEQIVVPAGPPHIGFNGFHSL